MPIVSTQVRNTEILVNLENILKVIIPLIATVVYLIVYAWKKMEKTQDKQQQSFEEHIKYDEHIHDQLFTESRKQGENVREHQVEINNIKDSNITQKQMIKSITNELDECKTSLTEVKTTQKDCRNCP